MRNWRRIAEDRLRTADAGLVEEVAQHLEDRYSEQLSAGAAEPEAYRQAVAELDDLYPMRAELKPERRAEDLADGIWKDIRFALRGMRKNPVFVLIVVLTLALGMGANTTVFTLINTLILNPLAVRDAKELVAVAGGDPKTSAKSGAFLPVSYADLADYRARNEVFTSLAGYTSPRPMTWQEHGGSEGIFAELVTANYFDTLGLMPVRGRFFAPDEGGERPIAVLNYAAWQKRFGAAANIVGREVVVNNIALTVIGVAPPHFIGINAIFGPDLWVPAGMAERLFPNTMTNALTDRAQTAFLGVARLKPRVAETQAGAHLATLASALAHAYPADEGRTAKVLPLREVMLAVGGNSASAMVFGSVALAIVVGIVLLIACSNVANLLLARSAARQQEMAVRLAMGASRYRLVRQLLTENVLLGLMSGAVGLFFAYGGLEVLFGRLPGGANFPTPKLDATVFAFALVVSLATGFLFGAIPAAKASRADLATALNETSRTAGRSRARVSIANALLVGQVAFSFLLLMTAALFLRSIGRAYQMDPGFQTAHLAVFPANPGQAGYGRVQARAYFKAVRDRVLSLPSVEAAAWASNMPLWARSSGGLQIEGQEQRSRTDQIRSVVTAIDPAYFATAGVSLASGRTFTDADRETSLPVAIVNEKMARDYWPAGAIGRRVQLPGEKTQRAIVGVARTANYTSWGEPPQDCVYVPATQYYTDSLVLYVRAKGDPREVQPLVQNELRAAGPQILVFGIRTGPEIIDGGLFQARMAVGLLTVFGLLALGLASIGLYGVLAYSVNQRKREIGLRMALGASPGSVLSLVLREGMTLVGAGVAIGLAGSMALGQVLSRMLFGIGAGDPLSIAGAGAMLAAVALLACYLPARWATRVDPLEALRES